MTKADINKIISHKNVILDVLKLYPVECEDEISNLETEIGRGINNLLKEEE